MAEILCKHEQLVRKVAYKQASISELGDLLLLVYQMGVDSVGCINQKKPR